MGTLFPDSQEYPDHTSIPSAVNVPVGTLTFVAYIGLHPICPIATLPTDDAPLGDYAPRNMVMATPASASSTGDLSINIPTEHLSISDLAPTVFIG